MDQKIRPKVLCTKRNQTKIVRKIAASEILHRFLICDSGMILIKLKFSYDHITRSNDTERSFKNLITRNDVRFLRQQFSVGFVPNRTRSYVIRQESLIDLTIRFLALGLYPGQITRQWDQRRICIWSYMILYDLVWIVQKILVSEILHQFVLYGSWQILFSCQMLLSDCSRFHATVRSDRNLTIGIDVRFQRLRYFVRFHTIV